MSGTGGAFEDTERTDPITKINRNIEDEPLIKRIKALELKLLDAMGSRESVAEDIEEAQGNGRSKGQRREEDRAAEAAALRDLLEAFEELLKTKYGSLGYLVSSTSADIESLYGIDTDLEYYCLVDGSRIRVPNQRLDGMISAGGGRRWMGERSMIIDNPAETQANMRVTDHAVSQIIAAIRKKLGKLGA